MQDNVVIQPATLLDRLRVLGLPPLELDLYFHLERMGPTTPAALRSALQLDAAELDPLLETLMAKGLVRSSFGRMLRFEAASLDAVAVDDS